MITVKRIQGRELPKGLALVLKLRYNTEPDRFIVGFGDKNRIMYVNSNVPQKDIEGFISVAEFPEYGVAEEGIGKSEFLDNACKKYGYDVYNILMDAHKKYMKQKEERRAKEEAKSVIPLIEKVMKDEYTTEKYDEFLAYEIWKYGSSLNRFTPNHIVNYGIIYMFYFGYLMGAGLLEEVLVSKGDVLPKKET